MSEIEQSPPQDLAAAYALGALDAAEARAFEVVLATSAEAQRELAEYREVSALLALGAGAQAPAPELRRRVLEGIARQKVVPLAGPARRPGAWLAWAGLAASLLVIAGLGWNVEDLRRQLAQREASIDSLR